MISKYMTRKDLIDAKINSLIEVQTYIEQEIERLSAISKGIDIEKKDHSFSEDQILPKDNSNDREIHFYKPNTGGATLFFMLKIPLLFLLLMLCAFVFSPICIIFSNTIIVLSLLSSTIRVIWKAQKV